MSYASAIKTADKWFSRYIRLKHSLNGTHCKCYTCGNIVHILEIDCGHFIGRANLSTRFHEDNGRPQDTRCNRYRSGEHAIFRRNLILDIGESRVINLERLPKSVKLMEFEVREIAEHYRKKFNELVKIKGNPWK